MNWRIWEKTTRTARSLSPTRSTCRCEETRKQRQRWLTRWHQEDKVFLRKTLVIILYINVHKTMGLQALSQQTPKITAIITRTILKLWTQLTSVRMFGILKNNLKAIRHQSLTLLKYKITLVSHRIKHFCEITHKCRAIINSKFNKWINIRTSCNIDENILFKFYIFLKY